MPHTAKRQQRLRRQKTSKRKQKKGGQKNKVNLRRKKHVHGGNCGCGKTLGGNVGCSGLSKTSQVMAGGNSFFQPSFSGLPISKFYPLNEYGGDPTHMSMASRLQPDINVGMAASRGGGVVQKSNKNRKPNNKTQKKGKKIRGGMNPGALLSNFNSMILGNGLPDNLVASQGNITGMVTANSVWNGEHNPTTASSYQLNKLYNDHYPPVA